MKERLASLISGGGTTMEVIARACRSDEIGMDVALVIASSSEAGGIEKAETLHIPFVIVNPRDFLGGDGKVDQEAFGLKMLKDLRRYGATVITQNGWLPLTPGNVIDAFRETIFNQHPGPLPDTAGLYGRQPHAARLGFVHATQRDFWTEAIAQRVDKNFDQGAVVKSARVAIEPDDTPESLQKRVLPIEHRLQIALLRDVVKGNVQEITNREKLVRPGEEHILFEARKAARALYPHG